ncbi:SDR family NAD(P)-dependent oxidoreductase [Ligilactobacillus acidipiscis]|uniref:SDR family NAD(P)-dependent oxidoreductase n=1 Tax=Ligilactobacillus acidipiscis TaxID=89059 RepID=UPI0023F61890|nr:SDR family NAD(P)-dependent oxidoreductase [Ligilactobacillus acidipiscis]WEV57438.1 SDR family NAD(P)-dependent oxidoreductase [Ligilactobacillus acidipiscis]
MLLEGKKIIVTGVSGTIASATVTAYVKEGAKVAALDVNDIEGQKVVTKANENGTGQATYYHCDVSKRQEVFTVFKKAIDALGGLDVLADVAGIARIANAEDVSEEQLDAVINVNLKGTVFTNQAAFQALKENGGGSIINYGSDSALDPTPGVSDYAAAKAGVQAWSRASASEWGKYNIRVNSVNPAIESVRGQKVANTGAGKENPEVQKFTELLKMMIPLGGTGGNAEKDAAPVMVFLASDASHFITGQIININGGFTFVR